MKQNRRSFLKSSATATSATVFAGLINTPGVAGANTTGPGTTNPGTTNPPRWGMICTAPAAVGNATTSTTSTAYTGTWNLVDPQTGNPIDGATRYKITVTMTSRAADVSNKSPYNTDSPSFSATAVLTREVYRNNVAAHDAGFTPQQFGKVLLTAEVTSAEATGVIKSTEPGGQDHDWGPENGLSLAMTFAVGGGTVTATALASSPYLTSGQTIKKVTYTPAQK